MNERSLAVAILLAALVLGGSILGASFVIKGSLETASDEVAGLRGAPAAAEAPRPPAQAPPAPAPRRLDPNQRYSVELADAPLRGPEDAPVTIVEWSDFQCPYCRRVGPTLEQIEKKYGDQVRFAFKHLPLSIHPKAPAAHAAAEAAHRQGRFWEMHDRIFADQAGMSPMRYEQYAKEMGLDLERFRRDRDDAGVRARIDADTAEARELGIRGTPAFFVNGRYMAGALPFSAFEPVIEAELARAGAGAAGS